MHFFVIRRYVRYVSSAVLLTFVSTLSYGQNEVRAVWYRYYDAKGVANISTSVTPNHIRYGYDALDRNMQVIRRNTPYRAEKDNFRSTQRASDAKQRDADATLRRAYGTSSRAQQKQKDTLAHIKKQIIFQQDQINQLQKDRLLFEQQIVDLRKRSKPIPPQIVQTLTNNQINLDAQKKSLAALKANYEKTKNDYDKAIQRLKRIE